jgi:hypothetical protein
VLTATPTGEPPGGRRPGPSRAGAGPGRVRRCGRPCR